MKHAKPVRADYSLYQIHKLDWNTKNLMKVSGNNAQT